MSTPNSPATPERLDVVEAALDAAWNEAGETSPIIARAVNEAYILLSQHRRLLSEVASARQAGERAQEASHG